jgi:hypothetical protein
MGMAKLASRRIKTLALVLFAALFAWLPAGFTAQQSKLPEATPAGIEVKIQAQPLRATVGDPIQIDLDFAFPRGYQFEFPRLAGQIGEFTILETFPGPDPPPRQATGKTPAAAPAAGQSSKELHHLARIVAAVYRTGEFEFPALPFMMRDAEGKELQVMSPVVTIRIDSVLQGADPRLKDLKKQAEIEEPFRWILWLVLGGLACILGLLLWWRMMRRRRPAKIPSMQPEMDPLDAAEAELRDLLGRGLLEKGLTKQFYVYLSDILKRGLEAGFGIQTVEKTTTEIMAALAGAAEGIAVPSGPEDLRHIELLLLSCDMVKFARYLPSRAENDEAVKGALQVLLDCRSRRQPVVAGVAPVDGVG